MRLLEKLGVTLVLFLAVTLCLPSSTAGIAEDPGSQRTLVFRGNDGAILWFFWDGEQTLTYISSEPDWGEAIFCGTGGWVGQMNWQTEAIASGKYNSYFKGPLMARVFYPMTPADVNWGDLCSWARNQPEPAAEGIVHFSAPDINTCAFGPGRNQWAWRFTGSLINLSLPCPGLRVSVSYESHSRLKMGAYVDPATCTTDASNIETIRVDGPTVSCIPK